MALLQTIEATMRFGGLVAVNGLNLSIEEKQIVAVIGPNGAGKTTAFNMITGVYHPSEGRILFEGEDLQTRRPDQIAKLGIARTFQTIRLFNNLTVLDNVLAANHLRVKRSLFAHVLHLPGPVKTEKEMLEHSLYLLERTGLIDYKEHVANSLPYGLQRRLEIARALATRPKLLLLDEPAAGMNPKESQNLAAFIGEIRDEFGVAILLIEHHMQLVMQISEEIYVLEYGNTIAHNTPQNVRRDPKVIKAYLGEEDG